MYHYDPLVLAFVLDLELQNLNLAKPRLVECVRQLESDDRGYVFHPDNLEILRHSGPVVASIANYQHPQDFDLEFAIKQTVLLTDTQDIDAKKHIFIILDKYEQSQEYGLKKALAFGQDNNKITIFAVGRRFHPSLSQVSQLIVLDNIEELTKHIIDIAQIKET